MSRLTRFCASVLVLGVAFAAQAQDAKEDYAKPLTRQGSAAFILTIKGLGDFGLSGPAVATPSMGTIFGVGTKYYISDDMALRILLGFNTTSDGPDSLKSSSSAFGIGVGAEWHMRPLYSTSPYIGAQVSFGSSSSSSKIFADSTNEDKHSTSALSIAAIAGFDWFFTRGMAAGAEMSLGFSSQSGTTTNGRTKKDTDDPSHTVIALSTRPSVHLLVYY